jgi:hypothetical protein
MLIKHFTKDFVFLYFVLNQIQVKMKLYFCPALFSIFFALSGCNITNVPFIKPAQLKCNGIENPSGTGLLPDFSWIAETKERKQTQSAYQIILDHDLNNLGSEAGCLWNTGKIISSANAWIPYSGPELKSGTQYYWKLRLWDRNDKPSDWSTANSFLTGLADKEDWGGARWIGYEEIPDSLKLVPGVHGSGDNLGSVAKKRTAIPYFRKELQINKKISKALVFVSGLGHYELYINGSKIGNRFLSPGWTDYRRSCLYNTYDVTQNLERGTNAVGVIASNGFFNVNRERYRKLVIACGAPQMILKLEVSYSDGSREIFISDKTWKTAASPVTFSSIYGGEDYDAQAEQHGWNEKDFNDSHWKNALETAGPGGSLKPETDHPLKIMQSFEPKKIYSIKNKYYVYDYGQNASGIIKLKLKGKKGQEVRLIPGELTDEDSLVTQKATGAPFYFSYTLKGEKEETWIPAFTYYGFRYVQPEGAVPEGKPNPGNLPVITGMQLLHTRNSSPETGSFKCSSQLFNEVYDLINWSIKSNLASVATDCPHREKLGWLEQAHLMGNSMNYIYDIRNLFNKIIDDMIEAQTEDGLVPDIAPEFVPFTAGFRDSPEWGSAAVLLPWDMYQWYGDTQAVRKAYPMMEKYIAYLRGKSENHILSHGLGDWFDLGPRSPGVAQLTPISLTATSIYYYDNKLMAEMAKLLLKKEDEDFYRKTAEEIRIAFNNKFFNPETMVYSTGSQTSYAMPLFFGIVDEEYRSSVVANLIKSISDNNKALTAGDIGYRYLLRTLEQEGYSQLIFEMNSRSDVPGYGYQLSKGATALTESWAALKYVSNNHMMLGHLMEWFYSGIGGIRQAEGSVSYKHIIIAPEPVGDLSWAETSCRSVNGNIKTSWRILNDELILKVTIPVNSMATIIIPQDDPEKITENNNPVINSGDVKVLDTVNGKTRCEVSSGEYEFKTPYAKKHN